MEPGKRIRALREERLMKPSDIERITKSIAETRGNPDCYISHSSLADIEAGAIPGIHKLFSLALCLKVPLNELLLPFGVDEAAVPRSALEPATDALTLSTAREPAFRFQLNFETNISSEETTLLKINSQDLYVLPAPLRARFDPTRYRYVSIGSNDDSMEDLLPPRSLVEIDTTQRVVQAFDWQTLRQRPVYLVWHPEGHTCCWCQVDTRELLLIPHPASHRRVRHFKMPNEATVVGRVTNAWLPFQSVDAQKQAAS
jgi:transcriptional regulator with XRE-family HTH domain